MIYLISNTPFDSLTRLEVCDIKINKFSLDLSKFSALIITSKNAISALKFNQIPPTNLRVYAIGEASAKAAFEYGFDDVYTAKNHHGDEFAKEIAPLLKDKICLFVKASKNVSDVSGILERYGVSLSVIDGYENLVKKLKASQKPPKNSLLIFTSPQNVRGFVENFGWDESYRVVSIGNSTSMALKGLTKPIISQNSTIKECVDIAYELEKNSTSK